MRQGGFTFNRSPEELLTNDLTPAVRPFAEDVVDLLLSQQDDLGDYSVLSMQGTTGTATITAAAGGVAVPYADPFGGTMTLVRVPRCIQLTMIGGAGANAIVKPTTVTTAGFTVQIYLAGVEQGAGSYSFYWLAVV